MAPQVSQVDFHFPRNPSVRVAFDDTQVTQDAGLLLLRQLDDRLGLTAALAKTLRDSRDLRFTVHTHQDLVRERVFAICQGYEDCNDAARLHAEPIFKAACDRRDDDADLASQPTLSRFEHRASASVDDASRVLLRRFAQKHRKIRKKKWTLTIDLDSTDDPAHGQQPLAFFHGHYGCTCYQQLYVYTADGDLLFTKLMAGTVNLRLSGLLALQLVHAELRRAFPRLQLRVRADNGFASPELYDWCDDHGVIFAINCGTSAPLCRQTQPLLDAAQFGYESELYKPGVVAAAVSVRKGGELTYQAESWKKPRRVIAKAQWNSHGGDQRFVATNDRAGSPDEVYEFYTGRGQMENWLKDSKLGTSSGRTSTTSFDANDLRLQLHGIAYQLLHELRRLAEKKLGPMLLTTLRMKLLRVAALIERTARHLWVRVSASFAWRDAWCAVARSLAAATQ